MTSRLGRKSTVAFPRTLSVTFRSDWSKLTDLENKDEDGQPHYPGWDLDAIKWLVEDGYIGAIGHEPADTDPATVTTREDACPYPGEQYILSVDRSTDRGHGPSGRASRRGRRHLLHLPQGAVDGVGYPARVFAVCPCGSSVQACVCSS